MKNRKMNRRDFLRLSVAAATGAAVAACAPAAPQIVEVEKEVPVEKEVVKTVEVEKVVEKVVTPTPGPAKKPVTITLFVGFGTGNDPPQIPMQEAMASSFHELYPYITVEYMRVPCEESRVKWATMYAAGTPPDGTLPTGLSGINYWIEPGGEPMWVNIEPLIERDKIDISDFFETSIKGATHPLTGELIGMPVGLYCNFLAYNKNIFDKAGIPYPTHNWDDKSWTYQKLLELAQELTIDKNGKRANQVGFDPDNIVQFGLDGWEEWTYGRAWGGEPFSEDVCKVTVNTPEWIEGLQFLQDLRYKYHVMPTPAQTGPLTALFWDPFGSGQVAMSFSWTWVVGEILVEIKDWGWDVAALPWGPKAQAAGLCIDCGTITAKSPHVDEVWEYFKYISKPGNSERLAIDGWGCLPPRKSGMELFDERFALRVPGIDTKGFGEALARGRPTEYWRPELGKTYETWDAIYDALRLGKKTAAECSAELQKELQKLFDEYWAKHPGFCS